jgi:hypothetical protein
MDSILSQLTIHDIIMILPEIAWTAWERTLQWCLTDKLCCLSQSYIHRLDMALQNKLAAECEFEEHCNSECERLRVVRQIDAGIL